MVLSLTNVGEYYKPTYNAPAFKSLNVLAPLRLGHTYLESKSRLSRPTFILERDSSDSESEEDDEYMDMFSLFDLPVELFLNGIIPHLGMKDLKNFRASCQYAKSIVDMSQDWDSRYFEDFNDQNPLPGSGFSRYARRADAICMVSGVVAKDAQLEHAALGNVDQDIIQMRATRNNNKTWMAPFMPMRETNSMRYMATSDLYLGADSIIYQVNASGCCDKPLQSVYNTEIKQLQASLARNDLGQLFRLKFDEGSERRLTLCPLDLPPVYDFMTIKGCNYALAQGVGLISWLSSDEQGVIDFATIVETPAELEFSSFAIYHHTYGTLVDIALCTGSAIYTLEFDRAATKAGMYHHLGQTSVVEVNASKVVYYEEGTFLVLCPEDYVYRLKAGSLTPVASLRNIADLVVSPLGFCMALAHSGEVYSWDLRTRREISTWAIGSIVKSTRVPIANPQVAKIEGTVVSISCNDKFAFALVA